MQYKIKSTGENIVADLAFVEANFPGDFEEVIDESAAEPVSTTRTLTKLAYMSRLHDSELAAIYTAAKSVVQVEIWMEKFKLATEINLDDAATVGGLQAMEAAGLIGAGRAAEILA